MEHQKILNKASNYKFVTRNQNIVNDQSNANYDVENEIIYNTEVLKFNLCDYNDAYILVRSDTVNTEDNNPTPVAFKNCAPFTMFITKTDGRTIHDSEDLNLVMLIYNLIKYRQFILF